MPTLLPRTTRAIRAIRTPRAWALVTCGLLVGTSVAGQAYTVRDAQGRNVEISQPPRRIVSLLPAATESLCALGACGRLVGVDADSNHPPEVTQLPHLGKLHAPTAEAIVRLHPDVVLSPPQPGLIAQLARFGIPVLVLDAQDMAGLHAQLRTLDALLQQQRADALLARLAAEIEQVARSTGGEPGRSVYFEVDATPYAAGPQSFIGELLSRLGARNILTAAHGPFPRLNPEYVVRHNPELIIHPPHTPRSELARRPGRGATPGRLRPGSACRSGRCAPRRSCPSPGDVQARCAACAGYG